MIDKTDAPDPVSCAEDKGVATIETLKDTSVCASNTPPNSAKSRLPIVFLLPCWKTPLLTSSLLYTALETGKHKHCGFVLLLDANDPFLLLYRDLTDVLAGKGMRIGYAITDGTPYCGKINRIAPVIDADTVCVIDSTHLPVCTEDDMDTGDKIRSWFASSPEPMRVGVFTEDCVYPVISRKLIDRMGYAFHPLAFGRIEAERYISALSSHLGVQSRIDGCIVMEGKDRDGVEIEGVSDKEYADWVTQVLTQTIEDEAGRIGMYLLA